MAFATHHVGAWRLLADTGWHRAVVLLSIVACVLATMVWVLYTLRTSPSSFSIDLSFVVIAFVSEGLLQRHHGRRILARDHWAAS